MSENYNWSSFYDALGKLGPKILMGIDEDTRELIIKFGSSSDMFWSDGLQDLLATYANDDDLQTGVLSVLELWRENVLEALDANFGIAINWKSVSIDTSSPLIDELVKAARSI